MKKREALNCFVKNRYGMELSAFIKQKVEDEFRYDYEIGHLLHISSYYVCKLRKAFGIRRSDGFRRRFEESYGPNAVQRFKKLAEDPDTSLADVARYFGFSRQYAHEVCKKIYGHPYTKFLDKKRSGQRGRGLVFDGVSEIPQPLVEAVNKLKSLGLPVRIDKKKHCYMISANGYTMVFKYALKPFRGGRREYFHINNVRSSNTHFHFVLFFCKGEKKSAFFIIPRRYMPRTNSTLVLDGKSTRGKYSQFKNAWNILTQTADPGEVSQ